MTQTPQATDSEGFTVAELVGMLEEWPREIDGRPCRVWLGISASQMRPCEVIAAAGDGTSDLMLDALWSDPAVDLARSNPDLPPLQLALSALSYAMHTPSSLWDDHYFHELATRATAALEGMQHADASLAAAEAMPSTDQPWLTRVALLPWRAARLVFRGDRRLGLSIRLRLVWWLCIESLRP